MCLKEWKAPRSRQGIFSIISGETTLWKYYNVTEHAHHFPYQQGNWPVVNQISSKHQIRKS